MEEEHSWSEYSPRCKAGLPVTPQNLSACRISELRFAPTRTGVPVGGSISLGQNGTLRRHGSFAHLPLQTPHPNRHLVRRSPLPPQALRRALDRLLCRICTTRPTSAAGSPIPSRLPGFDDELVCGFGATDEHTPGIQWVQWFFQIFHLTFDELADGRCESRTHGGIRDMASSVSRLESRGASMTWIKRELARSA